MKTVIVGASATIISGALTGFNGLVVGYDSIDNEVLIKLDKIYKLLCLQSISSRPL